MKTVHPDVHGSIRHPTVARIHPGSDMHHKMSDVFSFNNFLLTQKKKKKVASAMALLEPTRTVATFSAKESPLPFLLSG